MTSSLLQTYNQYPLTITKGAGSYIWDATGKKYLDFYGGHAVCLIGNCPKPVVEAIKEQSEKLIFYSNVFATEPSQILAQKLKETLLPHDYKAYFTNSGSEANEAAIKIARKHTGRNQIISFQNSWHGRSISTLSVTGFKKQHSFSPNLLEHTHFAEFGSVESVKKFMNKETAAVILEPIQSIGGINKAKQRFYTELAEICKQNGTLLIFDEVQTGIGRTGDWWFCQTVGVTPDIITTAKGLASGLPISVVLIEESISFNVKKGDHATTFGGGPVVCAAAKATLDVITQEKDQADEKFQQISKNLLALPQVKKVKGKGMLIGIEIGIEANLVVDKCRELGLIIGTSAQKNTVRLMPPITISKEEITEFAKIFSQALTAL